MTHILLFVQWAGSSFVFNFLWYISLHMLRDRSQHEPEHAHAFRQPFFHCTHIRLQCGLQQMHFCLTFYLFIYFWIFHFFPVAFFRFGFYVCFEPSPTLSLADENIWRVYAVNKWYGFHWFTGIHPTSRFHNAFAPASNANYAMVALWLFNLLSGKWNAIEDESFNKTNEALLLKKNLFAFF